MTEPNLHDLFDDAVRDEPDGPPLEALVSADLARGRQRRRTRRRRYAAGLGVAAIAVAGAVVVPNLIPDADHAIGPTDRSDQSETEVPDHHTDTEVFNSELLDDIDAAVTAALPDDLTAVRSLSQQTGSRGTTLAWEIGGADTRRSVVRVSVDVARPDLEPYDLCRDPLVTDLGIYVSSTCSAGWDAHDRWQIVAVDPEAIRNVVVIEAETAAAMTSWRHDTDGSTPLSEEEAIAVTDAALEAAAGYPTEEFASGIDRAGVVDVQDEIAAAIGNVIDVPLSIDTTAEPEVTEDPWSFTYWVRGPDRTEIRVRLWQQPRMYEMWCLGTDAGRTCDIGPHWSAYSVTGPVFSGRVGPRGGIDIWFERRNDYRLRPDLTLHDVETIADTIPMLSTGDVNPEQ